MVVIILKNKLFVVEQILQQLDIFVSLEKVEIRIISILTNAIYNANFSKYLEFWYPCFIKKQLLNLMFKVIYVHCIYYSKAFL